MVASERIIPDKDKFCVTSLALLERKFISGPHRLKPCPKAENAHHHSQSKKVAGTGASSIHVRFLLPSATIYRTEKAIFQLQIDINKFLAISKE